MDRPPDPAPPVESYEFARAPGHLIRRAQQVAVAVFAQETHAHDITPMQFAVLNTLIDAPGIDQVTVAARVALDAATAGSVIARLQAKGWVRREADRADRRRRLLWVTAEGADVVGRTKQAVARAQERILAPLTARQAASLVALLERLVAGHEVLGTDALPRGGVD